MASTKISALPAASTLTGAETIPLVQGGVTKKVTTDQFLTASNPSYTGTLTGGTGVVNLGSGQFYKDASGNVGLGTVSPTQRLTVEGRGIFSVADAVYATAFNATSGNFRVIPYLDSTSGTALTAYSAGYAGLGKMTFDASSMRFCTGGTERARIDASGNLGVGVTPSAWSVASSVKAIQLPGGALWNFSTNNIYLAQNSFWNGSARVYQSPAPATEYHQGSGAHTWFTAPSGTAGNPISFTQAMTLDASGKLGIGNTTPVSKLDVLASGGVNSLHLGATANTDSGGYLNSSGGSEALLSGGANYNSYSAPDFVMTAKATVASGIGCGNGMVNFWTNTGLTAGTTFNQSVKATIDASGNLIQTVNTTAATLSTNGTLTFSIVDNSTLRVSVRGSDGTTRTATLALT